MPTERQVTLSEALKYIETAEVSRRIDEVIIHHTWEPSASGYRGIETVRGVRRYHQRKWPRHNDNGYHIMIAPNGDIFFCCPLEKKGAHCKHRNSHSIGVSYIADFGGPPHIRSPLNDPTAYEGMKTGQRVVAALLKHFNLEPKDIYFHSDFSAKTCPGLLMDRTEYREAVADGLKIVLLPGSEVVDCNAIIEDGTCRCDLRSLAEALGQEVIVNHLRTQNKIYLRSKDA